MPVDGRTVHRRSPEPNRGQSSSADAVGPHHRDHDGEGVAPSVVLDQQTGTVDLIPRSDQGVVQLVEQWWQLADLDTPLADQAAPVPAARHRRRLKPVVVGRLVVEPEAGEVPIGAPRVEAAVQVAPPQRMQVRFEPIERRPGPSGPPTASSRATACSGASNTIDGATRRSYDGVFRQVAVGDDCHTAGVDGLVIRSADLADVPRIIELLESGALADGAGDRSDADAYRHALAEIRHSPDNDVLVAEVDGEVVGMCQLVMFRHIQRNGGRCAEIESMHVAPERRSQGIGAELVKAAIAAAAGAGCYRVQLTSDIRRSDAHRFYQRMGFDPSHVGFKYIVETG